MDSITLESDLYAPKVQSTPSLTYRACLASLR